jgi:ABC-type lipoprotein release transport system permease subunit
MFRLGLRNAFRSPLRLAVVVLLVAVPLELLLLAHGVYRAVDRYTETLRRNVDNVLQVRARGSMGHVNMVGNDDILPQSALETAKRTPHVAQVEHYLLAMTPTEGHNFAMVVGVNPGETRRLESHGEAGAPRIIAGRDLTEAERGERVAVVGKGVARWAGIAPEQVGTATLTLDLRRTHPVIFALERAPATLKVVGIHASGYVFGDMQLFIPIDTFREIYGVDQGVSWLYVRATSTERLRDVEAALRQALGGVADIVAPTQAAEFAATTTRTVLRLSAAGMALAGALAVIVVFFVMLIAVRERTREIGTLKALGASDPGIVASVHAEALVFAALGGVLAAALFVGLGGTAPAGLFGVAIAPFLAAHYGESLAASLDLSAVPPAATAALVAAAVLAAACLGTLWGARHAVRLSPVEAIGHE